MSKKNLIWMPIAGVVILVVVVIYDIVWLEGGFWEKNPDAPYVLACLDTDASNATLTRTWDSGTNDHGPVVSRMSIELTHFPPFEGKCGKIPAVLDTNTLVRFDAPRLSTPVRIYYFDGSAAHVKEVDTKLYQASILMVNPETRMVIARPPPNGGDWLARPIITD